MKVYTYYEKINTSSFQQLINLWKESWETNGFEPVVMTEKNAQDHYLYDEFSNKIKTFPSVNKQGFDYHCFMRYLAVSSIDDEYILSTEPDVINYSLSVDMARGMKRDSLTQYSAVPACHYGTRKEYEEFCINILNHNITEKDNYKGRPHFSDQDFIARYKMIHREYPNEYMDEVFRGNFMQTPLVHFCTGYMKKYDLLPKHEFINKIRRLDAQASK